MGQFFSEKDAIEHLIVLQGGSADSCVLQVECPKPEKFRRKGLYILKLTSDPITTKNITKDVVFLEMTRNILEHLYDMFYEVMAPVLQNPNNQQGWTDLVTKDLMEKFNNYVAQVFVMMGLMKGKTMLPLPSSKLTSSDTTPDKDKAHIFESSIITWTKQIKNVLKLEPEQALKSGGDPGPQTELDFWEKKAENLNSIYGQLQSVEVKNIIRFLEGNKSTYTTPFAKLQKDVQNARIEANDNNKYLKTLKDLFGTLKEAEFKSCQETFMPIMHTILLIWKNSKFYNTPPRLVVLIREICNEIIRKGQNYLPGQAILDFIQRDETFEACAMLQDTIDVCTKFKDAYFEYKSKAEGSWKLTTNALFVRLDSFLERFSFSQNIMIKYIIKIDVSIFCT